MQLTVRYSLLMRAKNYYKRNTHPCVLNPSMLYCTMYVYSPGYHWCDHWQMVNNLLNMLTIIDVLYVGNEQMIINVSHW